MLEVSAPWIEAMGTPPSGQCRAATWRKAARVVGTYRDRYRIIDDAPLGAPAESAVQKIDTTRARAAVMQAAEVVCTHAAGAPCAERLLSVGLGGQPWHWKRAAERKSPDGNQRSGQGAREEPRRR